jgi:hypothetical protein
MTGMGAKLGRVSILALLLAAWALATPGAASAPVHLVRLFPVQTGSCDTPTSSNPVRSLGTSAVASTPCPMPDTSASLRQDESYPLHDHISGTLASSSKVLLTLTFAQTVQGTSVPGYVDASVSVIINGASTVVVHAVGLVPQGGAYTATGSAAVPAAIRGKPVTSAVLSIVWNTGTTPWVEPVMDGTSVVQVPLVQPTLAQVKFAGKITVTGGKGRECPGASAGPSLCADYTGSGKLSGLGAVTMKQTFHFQLDSNGNCTSIDLQATLTTARKSDVNFAGKHASCNNAARWTLTITGGSGDYQGAQGNANFSVSASGRTTVESWSGTIHS